MLSIGKVLEHKNDGNVGFTLLELLVVLVIVGLMSALVGPKLVGSLSNTKLKVASKKVAAALRYARSQAASQNATYIARFDFDKSRLHIRTDPQTGAENINEDSGVDIESSLKSKNYILPEEIIFENALSVQNGIDSEFYEIIFFPNGNSSGGEIIIADKKEKKYKITVDFITGSVHLHN